MKNFKQTMIWKKGIELVKSVYKLLRARYDRAARGGLIGSVGLVHVSGHAGQHTDPSHTGLTVQQTTNS